MDSENFAGDIEYSGSTVSLAAWRNGARVEVMAHEDYEEWLSDSEEGATSKWLVRPKGEGGRSPTRCAEVERYRRSEFHLVAVFSETGEALVCAEDERFEVTGVENLVTLATAPQLWKLVATPAAGGGGEKPL